MTSYHPPLRDLQFCLDELLDYPAHYATLSLAADLGREDVGFILGEVAKFSQEVLAPLYVSGDTEGAHCDNGRVTSPHGFADAYRRYVDGGWPRLGNLPEHGGQPAPYSLKVAASEFMQTANHAWCMYALLNDGAIRTLMSFASPALVKAFVPKLVSGEWMSTMCLTEPQCGSDLNLVRCKAEATADGSYRITGKIFISSGEQDFSQNIVHLVLARLQDVPVGTRGISLFVVPKRKLLTDGTAGDANAMRCLSIEHKMGLKASATCVMAFDAAEGWLVGEPNRGLNAMFVYINKSRLGTAQQGQAHAEGAYQTCLAYARERRAGRAPSGRVSDRDADPLLVHPDIRRMLLTQKAIAEGGRTLVLYCAQWVDRADGDDPVQRETAERYLALLTPIAKGAVSEWGSEACDLGIQILGGHGYMKEWGVEQRVRDVRITRIYEGTTGIQALDLLGRKILGPQRETLQAFTQEILDFCAGATSNGPLRVMTAALNDAVARWRAATNRIEQQSGDANHVPAVAVDYLMLAGYVTVAWLWARAAEVALRKLSASPDEREFYAAKVQTAQFWFERILPRIAVHEAAIAAGSGSLMGISEEGFGAGR
ncbi:acyl-CoA dehydrogenase C-terminal domain-containing protein [Povalibacter sp.]|uniref:acyl-CoA dehydrogenase C-terminal domain-containing protein n=1 Tax=Povalibacter sp. TaxID=1962978 RepID=UPI002F3EA17B